MSKSEYEPQECTSPTRPCPFEAERPRIMSVLESIKDEIGDLKSTLAVGSERFRRLARHEEQIEALDKQLVAMGLVVEKILLIVNILRTVVFSGVGLILAGVLGAGLSLVLR